MQKTDPPCQRGDRSTPSNLCLLRFIHLLLLFVFENADCLNAVRVFVLSKRSAPETRCCFEGSGKPWSAVRATAAAVVIAAKNGDENDQDDPLAAAVRTEIETAHDSPPSADGLLAIISTCPPFTISISSAAVLVTKRYNLRF